jgi:hypothetical protein
MQGQQNVKFCVSPPLNSIHSRIFLYPTKIRDRS